MQILLNGKPREVPEGATPDDLVRELSLRDERLGHLQDDLEERLLCSAARLAGHQVTEARPGEDPTPVVGAWFTDGETRVDHQQHALSGLLFAERVLRHTPSGETDES